MATQAQVDAAELAMNNARSIRDGASASAQGYYNALGKCVSGKGNGKPLSSDNLPDFLEKGTADSCVEECKACSCKDGGCCKKETCINKVNEYNAKVDAFDTADANYETAKEHYEELSGQVVQAGTDLTIGIGTANIQKEADAIKTRYYVFGGIAIVVLVAGIFIFMKLRK